MQVRKSFLFPALTDPRKRLNRSKFSIPPLLGDDGALKLCRAGSQAPCPRERDAILPIAPRLRRKPARCRRSRSALLFALLALMIAKAAAQTKGSARDAERVRQSQSNNAKDSPNPAKGSSSEDAPARPISVAAKQSGSRFGLGFKGSTLGLGADLGVRIVRPINLRVGFTMFNYSADGRSDGTAYRGTLHLRSVQTVMDWFPFSSSFHVSPGAIFQNGNRITAIATPPLGQVQKAGDITYISDPQNPLTGKAQAGVRGAAPLLLVGLGNLVPLRHHFAYSVDLGVVYQGHPKSHITLKGGVCDPSGSFCVNVADGGDTQAQVRSAQHDLDKSVSFMRFYPVASIEFAYRF